MNENYAIEILRFEMYRIRNDIRTTESNQRVAAARLISDEQMKELRLHEADLASAIQKLSERS